MTPKALENKPPYYGWMREYLQAFNTLSSTRQYGMGPNPITLTEILAYLQIWGTDDRVEFIAYILKMDSAFLDAKARKAERDRVAAEQKQKAEGQGKK